MARPQVNYVYPEKQAERHHMLPTLPLSMKANSRRNHFVPGRAQQAAGTALGAREK